MTTLDEIPIGSRVRVAEVTGVDGTTMRLLEMGLTPGVEVLVIGTAPLGDPIELEVRGYRLSLRKSEARKVAVAVVQPLRTSQG